MDGELFLPEEWLGEEFAEIRKKLGIPKERRFETKSQLGLKMIKRTRASGLPLNCWPATPSTVGTASFGPI